MRSILLTLFVSLALCACSSRIEFNAPMTPVAAEAVNINTATADDLEKLPHIGRRTAEAIVTFREQNGPFRRVEQLMLIRGINESRLAELRPLVRVD